MKRKVDILLKSKDLISFFDHEKETFLLNGKLIGGGRRPDVKLHKDLLKKIYCKN